MIFLITVDSFRADRLNKSTSPNLWSFGKENIFFENAVVNCPGTPRSFKTIFTSEFPPVTERSPKVSKKKSLLSEILKKHGYITAGFNSNPNLSVFFGYDRGFDVFEDFNTIKKYRRVKVPSFSEIVEFLINDHKDSRIVNNRAKEFVDKYKNNDKCFCWLHYMDVHYPYASNTFEKFSSGIALRKAKYKPNTLDEKEERRITELYDRRVSEVDAEINDFINFLKEKGVYEDSLIIITADHGDEFGEHGNFFHGRGKLYDEMIRVPLIMKLPDESKKTIREQTDLIEVFPAITNLKIPSTKDCVISETPTKTSARTLEWKLIESNDEEELYNLKKDPIEQNNLAKENFGIVEELKKNIRNHEQKRKYESHKEKVNTGIKKLKKESKI